MYDSTSGIPDAATDTTDPPTDIDVDAAASATIDDGDEGHDQSQTFTSRTNDSLETDNNAIVASDAACNDAATDADENDTATTATADDAVPAHNNSLPVNNVPDCESSREDAGNYSIPGTEHDTCNTATKIDVAKRKEAIESHEGLINTADDINNDVNESTRQSASTDNGEKIEVAPTSSDADELGVLVKQLGCIIGEGSIEQDGTIEESTQINALRQLGCKIGQEAMKLEKSIAETTPVDELQSTSMNNDEARNDLKSTSDLEEEKVNTDNAIIDTEQTKELKLQTTLTNNDGDCVKSDLETAAVENINGSRNDDALQSTLTIDDAPLESETERGIKRKIENTGDNISKSTNNLSLGGTTIDEAQSTTSEDKIGYPKSALKMDESEKLSPTSSVTDAFPKKSTSTPSTKESPSTKQNSSTKKSKSPASIPLKSTPSDRSSLLTRGLSLFARTSAQNPRPTMDKNQVSSPNVSRYTRQNNDDDANSVSSDISRGVKLLSSSVLRVTENNNHEDMLKRHLEESGLVLVKRLVEFLSGCPPVPDEWAGGSVNGTRNQNSSTSSTRQKKKQRGLTLPASAVGWVSTQLNRGKEDNDDVIEGLSDCYQVPIQQLHCLQNLLRRVINLKISGEAWPPPLASASMAAAGDGVKKTFASIPEKQSISSRLMSKFSAEQSSVGGDDVDDASCATGSSRITANTDKEIFVSSFERYYHGIQHKPYVNMALFPNASKVVIDGIPPGWVFNLDSLKNLDMVQISKGCILDINQLFFPSDARKMEISSVPQMANQSNLGVSDHSKNQSGAGSLQAITNNLDDSLLVYSTLSKIGLSNCAIGETAGLRGRAKPRSTGETTKQSASDSKPLQPVRIPPFSRFPNLESLNLSHNEIFKTKSALAGLSSLPFLSLINLSHNRLTSMNDVFLHIGNVKELVLTGNEISSTDGLDRLYSLERLWLDENKIHHLANITGIAKLPFLMDFALKGNPLESDDPALCRIEVLNLFREVRCKGLPKTATYRDMQQLLPILDNEISTKDELVALKDRTFRQAVIPMHETPVDGDAEIEVDETSEFKSITMPDQAQGIRRIKKSSRSRGVSLRIGGAEILDDKAAMRLARFRQRMENLIEQENGSSNEKSRSNLIRVQYKVGDLLSSIRPEVELSNDSLDSKTNGNDRNSMQKFGSFSSRHSQSKSHDCNDECPTDITFPYTLPPYMLNEAYDDVWMPPVQIIGGIIKSPDHNFDGVSDDITPDNDALAADLAKENDSDVTSNLLNEEDGSTKENQTVVRDDEEFSILNYNSHLSHHGDNVPPSSNTFYGDYYNGMKKQESPELDEDKSVPAEDSEEITDSKSRKSMFSGIWEEAYRHNVVANSKNTTSDDVPSTENATSGLPDFNAAELNAVYDGPQDYSSLYVSNDLDLYYDSFVFPRNSAEDDMQDDNPREGIMAPRIQLYKFDRNLLIESKKRCGAIPSNMDFLERYIGVWTEDVLACGSYARLRLSPIQLPKRGFHGDTVSRGRKDVIVSESRKFTICLSDSALYFILDENISPAGSKTNQNAAGGNRSFPSRIPPDATFGAAHWPHAVMRHSLDCLRGVTIGFQFQRLNLRFSVPSPNGNSSLEYAYVVLTSNKMRTISLLQKIQMHVHDNQSDPITNEKSSTLIENDDKAFLDAIGSKADEVALHYQVLHQIWKRGDREAARRSFVLTSSQVYLIDEAYAGDGTNSDEENNSEKKLGDVSLSIIDSASLSMVSEIRAANEDPRMITLVIKPYKLKRAHRWRLVCNDGEGAERLIDDVRKAIRAFQ